MYVHQKTKKKIAVGEEARDKEPPPTYIGVYIYIYIYIFFKLESEIHHLVKANEGEEG